MSLDGGGLLTRRELEVIALVAEGLRNREIAQRLSLSPSTVKSHLASSFAKLGVANRTQAAIIMHKSGAPRGSPSALPTAVA